MSIWVKNSKILLTPQWGREPTFTPPHSFTPPPLKNDKAVCALVRRGHLFASKWVIFEKNGGDVKKWVIRVIL